MVGRIIYSTASVMSQVEVEGEVEQYCWLGSDLLVIREMADDESRNKETGWGQDQNKDQSSSWLQLSIGATTSAQTDHHQSKHVETTPVASVSGVVELDLLPACGGQPVAAAGVSDLLFQHPPPISFSRHPEINWPFSPFPVPPNPIMGIMPSPSSSRPMWSYFPRPFQFPAAADVAGPSTHIRVVDPPRRPHSGIWFMLQASPNQAKEPFLPQISRSYLRIKDERMTVRLLMKYLVRKLRLESESEQNKDETFKEKGDGIKYLGEGEECNDRDKVQRAATCPILDVAACKRYHMDSQGHFAVPILYNNGSYYGAPLR